MKIFDFPIIKCSENNMQELFYYYADEILYNISIMYYEIWLNIY